MTLLSYISYPTVDVFGNIKYIKIDLHNEKFIVNNEEIINTKDVVNEIGNEEDYDCHHCDCNDDICEYCDGDDLCFPLPNMKDNMIKMLEKELEKAKITKDLEMESEIIEALKTLNED
jgi:hypothetical protein